MADLLGHRSFSGHAGPVSRATSGPPTATVSPRVRRSAAPASGAWAAERTAEEVICTVDVASPIVGAARRRSAARADLRLACPDQRVERARCTAAHPGGDVRVSPHPALQWCYCVVGCWWMVAWQRAQTIRVFRRLARMASTQAGAAVGLYRLRSATRLTWWTVIPSRESHSSQIWAVSRAMSWRPRRVGQAPSIRRACLRRRSGMPPGATGPAARHARRSSGDRPRPGQSSLPGRLLAIVHQASRSAKRASTSAYLASVRRSSRIRTSPPARIAWTSAVMKAPAVWQ